MSRRIPIIGEDRWFETPKDESLPVLAELPPEIKSHGVRADGMVGERYLHFHLCKRCGGWVEGQPVSRRVDDLGMMVGRRGTQHHCRRCGREIGFVGMMA